jgi:hypothetical protein
MADSLEQQCTQKRNDILALAKRLADDGAHYLWNGWGEKPSVNGRVSYAPVVLDPDRLQETCFCAATIEVNHVQYVCAGRFRHADLRAVQPANKFATPKVGPPDPASAKLLQAFIEKNGKNPSSQVGWGFDMTPRAVQGKDVMDYESKTNLAGLVVWGEGCDDTQHFDCGGFVRYVVRNVCGVSIDGISDKPEKENAFGEPRGILINEGEDMLPADILVYPGHIAFAIVSTPQKYYSVNDYAVAQAESAVYGVNYGKTHHQHSTKCIRLSPSTLLNRKTAT